MTNPYAPPQAVVEDIIQPTEEMVPAERLTRLGAAILDSIIFMVAVYSPLILVVLGIETDTFEDGEVNLSPLAVTGIIGALAGFGVWCWFTLRYMMRNSQSIAKKFLDIKVVRSDGSRVSVSRIIWLRNVVIWVLSMIPFLGVVVGMLDALFIFGEARQCLHDKIADTIVVKA